MISFYYYFNCSFLITVLSIIKLQYFIIHSPNYYILLTYIQLYIVHTIAAKQIYKKKKKNNFTKKHKHKHKQKHKQKTLSVTSLPLFSSFAFPISYIFFINITTLLLLKYYSHYIK